METYVNRALRPVSPGVYDLIVNGENVARVAGRAMDAIRAKACLAGKRMEEHLNDFFFVITENPEPDSPSDLYFVQQAMRGSGRLIESFTTDRPYDAVEAAREAQEYTLEERLDMYAARGW